ncbi:hypothetical protein PTI98_006952 [Pleurotus ostreatus]|nr:hypothetical protein PTI98_006952 [Pleurotus ostreatus]
MVLMNMFLSLFNFVLLGPASHMQILEPWLVLTESSRAASPVPLSPPTRPLQWGDINILHTTDTHGWLLGHQKKSFPEPNYSGDLGDFASFVSHMKQSAIDRDADLLLVDTGDLHDGTGLSDGFPPGGIDGHDSNQFLAQVPYDVMAIGNHELYIYAHALDMHTNFAPQLKGRYLTSNVNITVADKQGNPVSIPLGNRFAKFKTRKGRRVTAFGVLFNFTGNDKNTTVQQVSDMVNEKWFHDAIQDEPDFFLVTGHMPVQRDDFPLVFNAIRAVHSSTPIVILGGHSHIRDCVQLDGRSMALESGRYMETIGWMSMDLDRRGSNKDLKFSRRYLDANRVTYEFHSRKRSSKFNTPLGKRITNGLLDLAKRFDLDFVFGTAPQDYVINQAPYPSNQSLLSLYAEQVVPVALSVNNTRSSIPSYFVTNSGSQRFDVFAGPFTKNDQIVASPFTNKFLFISNVTLSSATSVLPILNSQGELRRSVDDLDRREKELYAKGNIDIRFRQWLQAMDKRMGEEKRAAGNLTLGYVTHDSCPGVGDDIPHAPLPFFSFPDFIASGVPSVTSDTPIDLIFVDFIQDQLLNVLNSVQKDRVFSADDVQVYSPLLTNQVFGVYAQEAWN